MTVLRKKGQRERDPNERTDADIVTFMAHPERWPQWPFLPLKRVVDGNFDFAYLVDWTSEKFSKTTIFKGSIFHSKTTDEPMNYDTFDAIVRDGWRID